MCRIIKVLCCFSFLALTFQLAGQNGNKEYSSGSHVAILGESYNDENNIGANEEILKRLFSLIRLKSPDAVIFTGNMSLGLEKQGTAPMPAESEPSQLPGLETDAYGDNWPQEGFAYNGQTYRNQLEAFRSLFQNYVGAQTPIYPIIAKHESFGPDSASIFRDVFKVENKSPSSASPLAYTFSINNAFFVVFSIANYDEKTKSTVDYRIDPQLLDWLEKVLKENAKKYDFLFVIGNEPAFSTTATTGNYKGLDKNTTDRDTFWRILVGNHVTAYFCSKEHLYDRTNRYGIWQIISGGAGAPLYKREFDKAFYHYILLSIPKSRQQVPKVQVYDVHGNLNDEFELTPTHYPVYQLRIS